MKDNCSPVSHSYFSDLSRQNIRDLADMFNLPIEPEDLDEIRFRLSALSRELNQLDSNQIRNVDPMATRNPEGVS